MGMKIQGLEALRAKLKALPEAIKAEVRASLVQSGEEIAATARALAPVDNGDLQNSIKVTPPGQMTPLYSSGGSHQVSEMAVAVTAGNSSVRYAAPVEFGHDGDGKPDGAAPRPFFWPAYRSKKKRVKSRTARAVNKAAKKIWNGK
jgi:HK97 gp10 family phage protein